MGSSNASDRLISIHTPTQGVTLSATYRLTGEKISIHTPTQGVTIAKVKLNAVCFISIHTPTQGVTESYYSRMRESIISIHTPTQGVTYFCIYMFGLCYISIHTPTQGVTAKLPNLSAILRSNLLNSNKPAASYAWFVKIIILYP